MSNRLFARAVIASLLGLVGMSLGCDKSPSGPTPPAALPVTPPAALTVTGVSPTSGPTNFASEIRVAGTGFLSGATLTLDGVATRVTGITSTAIIAMTPVHAAGTVDVVVTNPGGQSATLTGGYTYELVSLTVSPDVVTAGGQLTVSWVAPSGRSSGDWVSLFRVGDPDASHGWAEHTDDAPTGRFTLSAPAQPGQYEFRYMVGENAAAHSSPVTIIRVVPDD